MKNAGSLKSIQPSDVSVVILNWNKADLAAECAKSVLKHSPGVLEVIIADNGSRPSELKSLKAQFSGERCFVLEIGVNRYFGEGNNIAAEHTRGDYILFLNNDVVVTENYLEGLLRCINEETDVGAVGPMFCYPNGQLQEAGAFLDQHGHSVQLGKGQLASDTRFNFRREVHYVSAACLLIRKSDFLELGGFNFVYEPAYYEDTDLCFGLRLKLHKKIFYEPSSKVFHYESATTADPGTGLRLSNISEINRKKFLTRWAGENPSALGQIRTKSESLSFERETKNSVGVYTPFPLTLGGGEKYILSVVSALHADGFDVTLITEFPYSGIRVRALIAEFGLPEMSIKSKTYSACNPGEFDVFISMGNEVFPPVDSLGKITIHHCQFPFPSLTTEKVTAQRLLNVDLIVLNSEFTQKHYLKKLTGQYAFQINTEVISPPVASVGMADELPKKKNPHQIVSIGRFFVGGHSKRQDLLIDSFRELHNEVPEATLHLIGGSLAGNEHRDYLWHCQHMAKDLPIEFHIDSPTQELESILTSSSVYWHAAGFEVDPNQTPERCEHFGISIVEAMGAGLVPLVVGNGGPNEFIDFGVNGFKYHTQSSLVRRTKFVMGLETKELDELRKAAVQTALGFDRKIFASKWSSAVRKLISGQAVTFI